MALQFTSDNFEAEVLQAEQPVLVDFWAEWCGPCKMIGPLVDAVANATEGTAKVGKVDVDSQQELARDYNIQSLPTIAFFKGGEVVETMIGTKGVTAEVLQEKLAALA
ncbi:MAG: thioredoxin [Roseibacillus sp.]|nr:thioredoxin [Roseibacillus sp.]